MQKSLPCDIDAEEALLSILLTTDDPEILADVFSSVPHETFYDATHQSIYRALRYLWKRGTAAPDYVTVSNLVVRSGSVAESDRSAISGRVLQLLTISVFSANYRAYADILLDAAGRRAGITAASSLVARLYDGPVATGEAAKVYEAAQAPFSRLEASRGLYGDILEEHRTHVVRRWDGDVVERLTPTGLRPIDQLLMGGFRQGELIFIGARPGMGKTSTMIQIADYAARATQRVSVIFELEMSREALLNRAIAAEAEVPFSIAFPPTDGRMADMRMRDRWLEASEVLESVKVDIQAASTTDAMIAHAEQYGDDLGAIYIDHLDYITDRVKNDATEQRTAELSRRCKQMATRLNVPVVVLSQLNREVERTVPFSPNLRNFRNSGAIEQDADHAILLYRRKYYVDRGMLLPENAKDYIAGTDRHRCEWHLAKNRNGDIGCVILGWDAPMMRFTVERVA